MSFFQKNRKTFINFYTISFVLFIVWMFFLDIHDFPSSISKASRNAHLKNEISYYEEKVKEVNADYDALRSDIRAMEKFGRENYLMKKETEDVYYLSAE